MDDSSTRMRANMDKVLRALDVVPPYSNGRGPDRDETDPAADARRKTQDARRNRATGKITIPEFDLGERILAEQRRITGKKRRAPGTSDEVKRSGRVEGPNAGPRMPLAVPSGEDLMQLHRIVADIVTRDIDRLCTGPI